MAKLDRLLNLTAALIETEVPLTAEEIREKVPAYPESPTAFHRSFERDKDDLRELGIPVETVTVGHHEQPKSAYIIRRERYELPDPDLTPDELAALHLAAAAVQLDGLDGSEAVEALRKLGGGPAAEVDTPIGQVPAPAPLIDMFAAVLERREVTFRYGDAERHVQPHRLQFERGRWYLTGHDLDRDARRSFRLDRVSGEVRVGEAEQFEPPEETVGVLLRPWEMGDGPAQAAQLVLDADIVAPVLAEHPALTVTERRPDGAAVVELQVRNPEGLRTFVLGLLDRAELLSPPELRQDLLAHLEGFRR